MANVKVRLHNVRSRGSVQVHSTAPAELVNVHAEGDISVTVSSSAPEPPTTQALVARPATSGGLLQRDFHRDSDAGKIAGVCAGLAAGLNINALWLRVAFLTLAWFGFGTGIAVYVIAWVLLPDRLSAPALPPSPPDAEEVPEELREAWREVNEITKN